MTGKAWRRQLLSLVDDRPFLPLPTVVRMLRAAYRGTLGRSPVRLPEAFLPGFLNHDRRRAYERKILRELGAHQLLAHGVSLERSARLIRNVGGPHRGSPLQPTTVAGLASGARLQLALMVERSYHLRVQPAGWRPPSRSAAP